MGQSNSMWSNLEQLVHGDASWSETGASLLEPLRMLSRSRRRCCTSAIFLFLLGAFPSPLILRRSFVPMALHLF